MCSFIYLIMAEEIVFLMTVTHVFVIHSKINLKKIVFKCYIKI